MYSVVVAAVLSAGTPAPGFGWHKDRGDGAPAAGCYGCMGGCQGCNGCAGGGFLGIRSFFRDLFSFGGGCNGCGGCMGGCQGCYGGCTGCYGGMPMGGYPVVGGMPSYSGFGMGAPVYEGSPVMAGGMPMGGMPMGGMPMGETPMAPSMPFTGDMGMNAPGQMFPGGTPPAPPLNVQQMPTGPMPQSYDSVTPPNMATVVVNLPADARLFVDNMPITLTGPVRVFRTPPLQPAMSYTYSLRIELDRGGRTHTDSRTVELQPGKTANVSFPEPGTQGTAARINLALPAGANLWVDGQPWPASQKAILTPSLAPGREYVYTLKLERDRDGQKESLTRTVTFRAGESVSVDFADLRQVAASQ
jgi:uncharacterized protein (TIGR03000 family)